MSLLKSTNICVKVAVSLLTNWLLTAIDILHGPSWYNRVKARSGKLSARPSPTNHQRFPGASFWKNLLHYRPIRPIKNSDIIKGMPRVPQMLCKEKSGSSRLSQFIREPPKCRVRLQIRQQQRQPPFTAKINSLIFNILLTDIEMENRQMETIQNVFERFGVLHGDKVIFLFIVCRKHHKLNWINQNSW